MQHHITFKKPESEGHTQLLQYPFRQEVDFYEVEHEHDDWEKGPSGWTTQYFRTTSPIAVDEQVTLRSLPGVEESDFNQE